MSADRRDVPVAILCGGRGTRLQERTHAIPKPLVEIGGSPIVWHVIQIYAAHGFRRFYLLTGYMAEKVEEFVGGVEWPDGVVVDCVDTGIETPTGGRVAKAGSLLDGGTFGLTYADGVADIDLGSALDFHRSHGDAATVSLVRPDSPWGLAMVDESDRVSGFQEKPKMNDWINGGFFFLEPAALAYLREDSTLEREPLERLAADQQLRGYRHEGFWDCMDTYKDSILLNDLWKSGEAPWKTWATPEATAR